MRTLFTPVTIYTRPGNEDTWELMDRLEEFDVDYEVVNLDQNDEAKTYVEQILNAGDTLPIICSDIMDPLIGYDYFEVDQLIADLEGN